MNKPDTPFYIKVDLYEIGEFNQLLVVPGSNSYVIVNNNEHLCTPAAADEKSKVWEQEDGTLDEEVMERIGPAIKTYTPY